MKLLYKFQSKYPEASEDCFIAENASVIGDVVIGSESSIWFGAVLRGDGQPIKIGKGSNIQDNCVIHVEETDYPTMIGDHVTVGHSAILHGCTLKDNCLIGMGSIILDGAEIGEHTIVGAGSLVTKGKKIPSGVLCMGSPARIIRELTEEEKRSIEDTAKQYIYLAKEYI